MQLEEIQQEFHTALNSTIDIENIDSVCLLLGPYRNLTTIVSSIASLHPEIQVLNHAGSRVLNLTETNFLANYSQRKFEDFMRYFVYISQSGKRGFYGGSILLAHAYVNNPELQQAYRQRFGENKLKQSVKCLFWKEPMLVTQFVRQNQVDLLQLAKQEPRLRFILPIRNPIDCTISHVNTGSMANFFAKDGKTSELDILEQIIQIIAWFAQLAENNPHQFKLLPQNKIAKLTDKDMTDFLKVSADKEWQVSSEKLLNLKDSYNVSQEAKAVYKGFLDKYLSEYPKLYDNLLQFAL